LGPDKNYLVIASDELSPEENEQLLNLLKKHRKVIGYLINDLKGLSPAFCVNTKIWHRKESELWAQLGEQIRPEEGRFLQKDSAKELAVGSWLPFGKESVCADCVGLRDDVARAERTNGWISDRT
jgi:hypothetical protein